MPLKAPIIKTLSKISKRPFSEKRYPYNIFFKLTLALRGYRIYR